MLTEYIWQYVLFAVLCYFMCNLNFAILLSTRIKHADIRAFGSGNPGTTNMLRVFGFGMGGLTFVLDIMKGIACAGLGLLLFKSAGSEVCGTAAYIGGVFAGLGHIFPVFYGFKGGKGVATGIGFMLMVNTEFALIALAAGMVILIATDKMSVFSVLFYTAVMIQQIIVKPYYIFIFVIVYWAMLVYAHRGNIERLLKNQEKNLGLREKVFGKPAEVTAKARTAAAARAAKGSKVSRKAAGNKALVRVTEGGGAVERTLKTAKRSEKPLKAKKHRKKP